MSYKFPKYVVLSLENAHAETFNNLKDAIGEAHYREEQFGWTDTKVIRLDAVTQIWPNNEGKRKGVYHA